MTFVSQIAPPASSNVRAVRIPSPSTRSRTSRIAATPLARLMITIVRSVSPRSNRGLLCDATALPDDDHEQQQRGDRREDPALVVRDPVRQRVLEHDREEDRRGRTEERLYLRAGAGPVAVAPLAAHADTWSGSGAGPTTRGVGGDRRAGRRRVHGHSRLGGCPGRHDGPDVPQRGAGGRRPVAGWVSAARSRPGGTPGRTDSFTAPTRAPR